MRRPLTLREWALDLACFVFVVPVYALGAIGLLLLLFWLIT